MKTRNNKSKIPESSINTSLTELTVSKRNKVSKKIKIDTDLKDLKNLTVIENNNLTKEEDDKNNILEESDSESEFQEVKQSDIKDKHLSQLKE